MHTASVCFLAQVASWLLKLHQLSVRLPADIPSFFSTTRRAWDAAQVCAHAFSGCVDRARSLRIVRVQVQHPLEVFSCIVVPCKDSGIQLATCQPDSDLLVVWQVLGQHLAILLSLRLCDLLILILDQHAKSELTSIKHVVDSTDFDWCPTMVMARSQDQCLICNGGCHCAPAAVQVDPCFGAAFAKSGARLCNRPPLRRTQMRLQDSREQLWHMSWTGASGQAIQVSGEMTVRTVGRLANLPSSSGGKGLTVSCTALAQV